MRNEHAYADSKKMLKEKTVPIQPETGQQLQSRQTTLFCLSCGLDTIFFFGNVIVKKRCTSASGRKRARPAPAHRRSLAARLRPPGRPAPPAAAPLPGSPPGGGGCARRRAPPAPASRPASRPELKGSIGEGSNHSNFLDQSSVKILS